jgi:hypothetical protein
MLSTPISVLLLLLLPLWYLSPLPGVATAAFATAAAVAYLPGVAPAAAAAVGAAAQALQYCKTVLQHCIAKHIAATSGSKTCLS